MDVRWRSRLGVGSLVMAGLVVFGSAEAKPTRVGPEPAGGGGDRAPAPGPTTNRDGTKKPSAECRACNSECDVKRIKCVPTCGKSKSEVAEKQQKCVSYCFNKAVTCRRECDKTKCKE